MEKRQNRRWVTLIAVMLALCLLTLVAGVGIYLFRYVLPIWAKSDSLPTVWFHAPTNGDEVAVGATVPVEIGATVQGSTITLLQVWADGVLVGEMPTDAEAVSGSWGWLVTSPGDHTLVARAFDAEGRVGVAAVRVRAVETADADQDGVPDEADACPDQAGLLQQNGCPPGVTDAGDPRDPDIQEIVDRWVPPGTDEEQIGEASLPGEEETAEEGEIPSEEESTEEGAGEEEEGEGLPPWFDRRMPPGDWAVGRNCPLCPLLEDLMEREEEEEEEGFRDEALSGIVIVVKATELRTAEGWSGVYCYVRFTGEDWTAVPDSQQSLYPKAGGFWDIAPFLGGEHGRAVTLLEGEVLRLEMECLGRTDDPVAEPQYLGHLVREHGPEDWNGQPLVARAEAGGNWFEVTYRICAGGCDEDVIPPPYGLRLRTEQVGGTTVRTLSWQWRGDREQIDGFNVYRCFGRTGRCHLIDIATVQGVVVGRNTLLPPCGQTYRFEVRAFRQTEDGIEESLPSNPVWSASSAACAGRNRLAIQETRGPTRYRARMYVDLEYRYIGDHGDRVSIFAYPLKGGEPDPSFFWSSATVSGAEDGETTVALYYAGSERHTTDGLRLVMVSQDGEVFYRQDVAYPVEWYPSQPDLMITRVEPVVRLVRGFTVEEVMRIYVHNAGDAPVWSWDGQLQIRLADGRVLSHPSPSDYAGFLSPGRTVYVLWPWWREDVREDLEPSFQVVVDPANTVAELNEENNVYEATANRVRVVLDKMTAYGHEERRGGFIGLTGDFHARTGGESRWIHFDGAVRDDYVTQSTIFGDMGIYDPHEEGISICLGEEYDFGDQIFPAIRPETCPEMAIRWQGAHMPCFLGLVDDWPSQDELYDEICGPLAEQGSAPETDWVEIPVWPGHDLQLSATLYDVDVEYQFPAGHREEWETVCEVGEVITPEELEGLPMEVTLGSPEEGCEVVVHLEPAP